MTRARTAPGAEVRRLHGEGQLHLEGRRWDISRALAGEWVELIRVEGRILIYYCRSLVRELDPHLITPCQGCPGT